MNPLRWIRWKLLAVLVTGGLLLYFVGLDPLARWQINSLGKASSRARWEVEEVGLALAAGDLQLRDLLVATARGLEEAARRAERKAAEGGETEEEVFNAPLTRFDLDMEELLRRRFVVDLVSLTAPRLHVARRADGGSNLGDLGRPPAPAEEESREAKPAAAAGEARDWVATAREWHERLKKLREKLRLRREEREKEEREGKVELAGHTLRRALYPFADHPAVLVRRIEAHGLEVAFSDATRPPGTIPPLEDATLTVTGLSSSPELASEPIGFRLEGSLRGAPVQLGGTVDLTRSGRSKVALDLDTGSLPAAVIDVFAGRSLPVALEKGNIALRARVEVGLEGNDVLLVEPRLSFQSVRLREKDPAGQVAGLPARKFTAAFNEASEALGDEALEIADLRITGTLSQPRFEWGDTVRNLVLEGGKAFARKQLSQARARVEEEVSKVEEKVREAAGKEIKRAKEEIDKVLGGTPAGEGAKETIEKVLPPGGSAEEAAKKGIDLLEKGLFGGGRKKNDDRK